MAYLVEFPLSHSRMLPASEGLTRRNRGAAAAPRRDPGLDAHVAAAAARQTGRGWRLDKSGRSAQIDAVVALAMAVERAQTKPEPVRLLGVI